MCKKGSLNMKKILFVGFLLAMTSCSSTVVVKKDTCKEIYGGTLMECERVTK